MIVDEEHEPSYKQQEGMPRYHAREVAIVLAQYHHAQVILGSATPSLESYYNAKNNKYGLVVLKERFGKTALPVISLANLRMKQAKNTVRIDFTKALLQALHYVLTQKSQALIFQNRRGYAVHIACQDCAWIPMCKQCAVSLTYHQREHQLCCHYCGYHQPMPSLCKACQGNQLKQVGFGTEKLEESLQVFFPKHHVQRMDLDTTRGKHRYDQLLQAVDKGVVDILVGTQMITKGLDFGGVALVGVVDIDRLLYWPDFRAGERCFQLLVQVSGRAGRREKQGKVIIQTAQPENPVLQEVVRHDYEGMYCRELAERRAFRYPPYVRLVRVVLKHRDKSTVSKAAHSLANALQTVRAFALLGPHPPMIARLKNQYCMDIWVKLPKDTHLMASKQKIQEMSLAVSKAFKQVQIIFDVDPV